MRKVKQTKQYVYANDNSKKNIKTTLPKTDDAKEFLVNVAKRFKTADKSLAGTLMAKLTTMKFDGMRGIQEHVLEMTNLAAQLRLWECMQMSSFSCNSS